LKSFWGTDLKKCSKCGETKNLDDFYNHKISRDGKRPDCKACSNDAARERRINGKDNRKPYCFTNAKINGRLFLMRKTCPYCNRHLPFAEFFNSKHISARDGKSNKCKECVASYKRSRSHLPHIKEARRRYVKSNPGKIKSYARTEKAKATRARRERERASTDPVFRLNRCVRSSMHASLQYGKGGKSWQELAGYSLGELRRHLEKQFQPGMTWDNYGEWHVDHIIPKAMFSFTTHEDAGFRQCWALSNLQPLWAIDNLKKSDTFLQGVEK
jgi:hypothetical protein